MTNIKYNILVLVWILFINMIFYFHNKDIELYLRNHRGLHVYIH